MDFTMTACSAVKKNFKKSMILYETHCVMTAYFAVRILQKALTLFQMCLILTRSSASHTFVQIFDSQWGLLYNNCMQRAVMERTAPTVTGTVVEDVEMCVKRIKGSAPANQDGQEIPVIQVMISSIMTAFLVRGNYSRRSRTNNREKKKRKKKSDGNE